MKLFNEIEILIVPDKFQRPLSLLLLLLFLHAIKLVNGSLFVFAAPKLMVWVSRLFCFFLKLNITLLGSATLNHKKCGGAQQRI